MDPAYYKPADTVTTGEGVSEGSGAEATSTLTIDVLRHISYRLQGIGWRVSAVLPDGMVLLLSDGSVAVAPDIDKAVSASFDLLAELEKLQGKSDIMVIDLRGCREYVRNGSKINSSSGNVGDTDGTSG